MIELLSRWFIRNRENTGDPAVRLAYGRLCGLVGIGLNLLLFGGKLFAGTVSGSVAVTADAFWAFSWRGRSRIPSTPSATGASSISQGWWCRG